MNINYRGFLYEAVNRQIVFYHRTDKVANINSIGTKGILPELNDSAAYGKGLYGTTSLESQFGENNSNDRIRMQNLYGKYIVKFRTITDNLLIINPNLDSELNVSKLIDNVINVVGKANLKQYIISNIVVLIDDSNEVSNNFSKIKYFLRNLIDDSEMERYANTYNLDNSGSKEDLIYSILIDIKNKFGDMTIKKNYSQGGFIKRLVKDKLLNKVKGFCFYGENDGDVIVLRRGAVTTPIVYSNMAPRDKNEIIWKPVSKAVINYSKKMLHNTINSEGDNSYTIQSLYDAYIKDNIDEFNKILKSKPNLIKEEYKGRNLVNIVFHNSDDGVSPKFIDVLNNYGMINTANITQILDSINNGGTLSPIIISKIFELKDNNGNYTIDREKVKFDSENAKILFNNPSLHGLATELLDAGNTILRVSKTTNAGYTPIGRIIADNVDIDMLNNIIKNLGGMPLPELIDGVLSSVNNEKMFEESILKSIDISHVLQDVVYNSINYTRTGVMKVIDLLPLIIKIAKSNGYLEMLSSKWLFNIILKVYTPPYSPTKRSAFMYCLSMSTFDYTTDDEYYSIIRNLVYAHEEYQAYVLINKAGINNKIKIGSGEVSPLLMSLIMNSYPLFTNIVNDPNVDINSFDMVPVNGNINPIYHALLYNLIDQYTVLIHKGALNQISKDSKMDSPVLQTNIKKYNVKIV